MKTSRMRRAGITSASDSTPNLITPRLENLTVGPVPTDSTNVVVAGPNDVGITDKLNVIMKEYQADMVRLPSTGKCASDITAKVPKGFISALYEMLNVNNNGCYQETQTFLQMLTSYLSKATNEDTIPIPRNFWKQLGDVFHELNINETKLKSYASILRSMSMAITSDVQALPSNNLLVSTLDTINDLNTAGVDPIDEDFQTEFPETIMEQPQPNEVMTEVLSNVPTTIGESSSNPPTNMIDLTPSDTASNIQIHDLDVQTNVEAQAYTGLKELFSTNTLNVPLSSLRIINNGKVTNVMPTSITYLTGATMGSGSTIETTSATTVVYAEQEIDVSELDVSKSLLEQDWAVSGGGGGLARSGQQTWIHIMDLIHPTARSAFSDDMKFRGAMSKREYTLVEARSIASALSGIWNKVVSMKLPTPQHIQTGTAILAAGLGAAGQIFGSSGLVTASKVVGSINTGLGSFIANITPSNGLKPEPKASICKNALAVVPSVIETGKGVFESLSTNAQHQRIKLSGYKNAVENGYIASSNELAMRSRSRRVNNTFY